MDDEVSRGKNAVRMQRIRLIQVIDWKYLYKRRGGREGVRRAKEEQSGKRGNARPPFVSELRYSSTTAEKSKFRARKLFEFYCIRRLIFHCRALSGLRQLIVTQ